MAHMILTLLNKPKSLIQPITDRPGHDRRYALDCSKAETLGWKNEYNFEQAIEATVKWYVENEAWWRKIRSGQHYQEYYHQQYAGREVNN
jgi:dTDP-glucose 4,6-dehydratase